jgi:hypothetical protein
MEHQRGVPRAGRPQPRGALELLLALCLGWLAPALVCASDTALIAADGTFSIRLRDQEFAHLAIGAYDHSWAYAGAAAAGGDPEGNSRLFRIAAPGGAALSGVASYSLDAAGALSAAYSFSAGADLALNSLNISLEAAASTLIGGQWQADKVHGGFAADFGQSTLFSGRVRALTVTAADGRALTLTFGTPTQALIQDNRRWGPSFSLRIEAKATLAKGEGTDLALQLSTPDQFDLAFDRPLTITRSARWIPLELELDVVPGSALDFSALAARDAPAGSRGRVVARPDGQFAFANQPATARRFYGVNLCFGAQYLAHDEADRLCDRLLRLGYNAVRIHHYEDALTHGRPLGELDPEALDRLDYLLAGLGRRGLYVTTDLFVSRTVSASELELPPGQPLNFKVLVPVLAKAMDNWKAFTAILLNHRNPYTSLRWADDPTVAWLSMINEGNVENYYGDLIRLPAWSAAFTAWLRERYADRAALNAAWGVELGADEDPAVGPISLPRDCNDGSRRSRDLLQFLALTEQAMFRRMAAFIHRELGCSALLTNTNAWTNRVTGQLARTDYDYVDDHFYVDHPSFIGQPWQLPSRNGNENPLRQGVLGGCASAFVRMWDKPFTVTEYGYCAPGRYRGMGGLITGALGALQSWGGIWRFAYSHGAQEELEATRMDYFNLVCDPLAQAADRAALCLFLRGDLRPAGHRVAITFKGYELEEPAAANPRLVPGWDALALVTGVGTLVERGKDKAPAFSASYPVQRGGSPDPGAIAPYAVSRERLLADLRAHGVLDADAGADAAGSRSDTGELAIDAAHGTLVIDTPRSAGGFSEGGAAIRASRAGVTVSAMSAPATVFVTALDDQPIATSRRLLVTHLTDVQNSGTRFAESACRTLLAWGTLPHLAAAGSARLELTLADPAGLAVWALSSSGRRLEELPAERGAGLLTVTLDVAGPQGARMLYEIAPR